MLGNGFDFCSAMVVSDGKQGQHTLFPDFNGVGTAHNKLGLIASLNQTASNENMR